MSRHTAERWPIRWLKGRHTCLSRTLTLGMDFLQLPPLPFIELAVSPPSEQAWPPALTQGENRFRDQETCWRFTTEKHQLNNLTLSLAVTFASSGIIFTEEQICDDLEVFCAQTELLLHAGREWVAMRVCYDVGPPCHNWKYEHMPFTCALKKTKNKSLHPVPLPKIFFFKMKLWLHPYKPYAPLSDCVYQLNLHYPLTELIHFIRFSRHRF